MKTHYEVLKLDKDCTAKEIKDSYLKLSKEYHPDRNKSADAHSKFVEVNEAYSVLGKSNSRHIYDESLTSRQDAHNRARAGSRTYEYYTYTYAKNQKRQQEYSGLHTSKSKFSMILFCFAIMAAGSLIQVKADINRRYVRSQQIAAMYSEQKDLNKKMTREEKVKEIEAALLNNWVKRERLRKQ